MNTRLEELKKQATEVKHSHGAFGEHEKHYRLNEDKFAELIALECAKVCEDYAARVLKFSQFGSNAAADCAKMIKDHFGLK